MSGRGVGTGRFRSGEGSWGKHVSTRAEAAAHRRSWRCARRRRSSRSRCSGRRCPRAPPGPRPRTGRVPARAGRQRRRRARACRTRTAPRPASTNAVCTGWRSSPSARPSTVTTSWPSDLRGEDEARAHELAVEEARSTSRTRPARTRSSTRAARACRGAPSGGFRRPRGPPRRSSAVDRQRDLAHERRHLSSARPASTPSAWRR